MKTVANRHTIAGVGHSGKIFGHEIKLLGNLPSGHMMLKRIQYTPIAFLDGLYLSVLERYALFQTLTRGSLTLDRGFATCFRIVTVSSSIFLSLKASMR